MLASVNDGILTIGTDRLIRHFNASCEKIFGYKAEEIIGNPIESLLPERFHEKHKDSLKRFFQTREPDVFLPRELPAMRKNGEEFTIELTISEYHVKKERYFVAIIRDLSGKYRTMQELQYKSDMLEKQNRKLQEGTRLKSEFLANMSHELRTPLNSIIGLTDQLLLGLFGNISEKQRTEMKKVLSSGKGLLTLINDILDLSKIEAGKMDFRNSEVSLSELIHQVMHSIEGLLRNKQIGLTIDVSPQLPKVFADPDRIKQILLNLLSNAIKFTDQGKIIVNARYKEASNFVELDIEDTGIGISKDDCEHIFEAFRQVDGSSTRKAGGTGLGLAITKNLTKCLNGKIKVKSKLGEGTVFTVFFPIQPQAVIESEEMQIDPRKKMILIIEDNENDFNFLKEYVEKEGFQVIWSLNGKEGFEKAKKYHPFAIILDILLPQIDGWELAKWFKEDPLTKDIPVVVITVLDNQKKGFSLGAFDYLIKPIDYKKLRNTLERLYNRLNKNNKLTLLIIDDEKNYLKSIYRLLRQEGYELLLANSGEDALEILEKRPLDLIVTDLMMPGIDGFDLIRQTKKGKNKEVPIIVSTAKVLTIEERNFLSDHTTLLSLKGDDSHLLLDIKSTLHNKEGN